MKSLLLQGWWAVPHSLAVVNAFQTLALKKENRFDLFKELTPYANPNWKEDSQLFSREELTVIKNIPEGRAANHFDICYRIAYPYDFSPNVRASKNFVFCVFNFGFPKNKDVVHASQLVADCKSGLQYIVTPSNWSKKACLRLGVPENSVSVVPHGVEIKNLFPLQSSDKKNLKENFGWKDRFVFLHVGAMTANKGVDLLLSSFLEVLEKHPEAFLVLKGADDLYPSKVFLADTLKKFSESARVKILANMGYMGQSLGYAEMGSLYQAADCYVSPYLAEGFNMPVLEAMACGLPVIVTKGGPTDDFVPSDWALKINSSPITKNISGEDHLLLEPEKAHLTQLMHKVIEESSWCVLASEKFPALVQSKFSWEEIAKSLSGVFEM